MYEDEKICAAQEYLFKAYKFHLDGKIEEAIKSYSESIIIYPTPEAYIFLGWAFSMRGEYEDAISQCIEAIKLDSDYGNAFNDVGSYLICLKRFDEALPWLERAVESKKYAAKHFPYYNLGRISEKKGDWYHAIEYYNMSLKLKSDFAEAEKALVKLMAMLN
jgi:Tfp pilus assembly protein PilF